MVAADTGETARRHPALANWWLQDLKLFVAPVWTSLGISPACIQEEEQSGDHREEEKW